MWTGLILTILISVYPGEFELNDPEGRINIVVDDNGQYIDNQHQLSIGAVRTNIDIRLQLLQELYHESNNTAYLYDCDQLIKEIQFLLSLLPGNYYFTFNSALCFNDPLIQPVEPMSAYEFAILIEDFDEEPFSDNRLNLLRFAASSNFFLVKQVEIILEYFVFEDDKIEAVRILYPQILDDENSYRLFDEFIFSHSKEELAKILH